MKTLKISIFPHKTKAGTETNPKKTLHITNLQRPFPLQEFKALLSSHGPIDYFWIDEKKSHAICSVCEKSLSFIRKFSLFLFKKKIV